MNLRPRGRPHVVVKYNENKFGTFPLSGLKLWKGLERKNELDIQFSTLSVAIGESPDSDYELGSVSSRLKFRPFIISSVWQWDILRERWVNSQVHFRAFQRELNVSQKGDKKSHDKLSDNC